MLDLSVIILTYNEEIHIQAMSGERKAICLKGVCRGLFLN